jgi:hypothetical protein
MPLTALNTNETRRLCKDCLKLREGLLKILRGAFGKCVKVATFTLRSYQDISRVIGYRHVSDLL